MWFLEFISDFFSHPFVIAITVFLMGKYVVNKIIPDKKQKVVEAIVTIRNLIKEVELIYDRTVFTLKDIVKDIKNAQSDKERQDAKERAELFQKSSVEDINRMSDLVNDKIPIEKFKLDSEIEIYFDDKNLTKIHNHFNNEFEKIHNYIVIEFPKQHNDFQKKFTEIKELNFDELKKSEKKLIDIIRSAKSIKFKSK